MRKYIKRNFYKKDTVYTMFTFKSDGIEILDVIVEVVDHSKEVIIVRELCDVYQYTLAFADASERLLHQVYSHD